MTSNSRKQLENWIKNISIPDGSLVLDVGGSQNPVKNRLNNVGANCEFRVLDLEEPHECKQKPDIICDLNNVNFIHTGSCEGAYCWEEPEAKIIYTKDKPKCYKEFNVDFDVVFCLEVSEYWFSPINALKNINYFLKKKGDLFISFHFLYPIHKPSGLDYLRYTEYGAIKLLEETGFRVEEIKYREMSASGEGAYLTYNAVEGNREDKDYKKHFNSGYLIKAVKI